MATTQRRFFTIRIWAEGLGATGKAIVVRTPVDTAEGLAADTGRILGRQCQLGTITRYSIGASTSKQIARNRDTAPRWEEVIAGLEEAIA